MIILLLFLLIIYREPSSYPPFACMSNNGFIPLGNSSFTGCGYVIVSSSSSSSSKSVFSSDEPLRCMSLTYPFWPLPSPSPVLAAAPSPSCCIAEATEGRAAVWAFVAAAGLGIPLVDIPPFAFDDDRGDADDGGVSADEDSFTSGGFGWAQASAQSATRMCSVSFTPQLLAPTFPPTAAAASQKQAHGISCSVAWGRARRSRYEPLHSSLSSCAAAHTESRIAFDAPLFLLLPPPCHCHLRCPFQISASFFRTRIKHRGPCGGCKRQRGFTEQAIQSSLFLSNLPIMNHIQFCSCRQIIMACIAGGGGIAREMFVRVHWA